MNVFIRNKKGELSKINVSEDQLQKLVKAGKWKILQQQPLIIENLEELPDQSSPASTQVSPCLTTVPFLPTEKSITPLLTTQKSFTIGEILLDTYKVVALLGKGGFGEVYKLHHLQWNVEMAGKIPHLNLFHNENLKQQYIREAEIWSYLGRFPHIVSCYYVREIRGLPIVFMEYIAGSSLDEWIRQHNVEYTSSFLKILDIAIQIAWGLQYAHLRKIIHQDIKPANIMISELGLVKITDFGLAGAYLPNKHSEKQSMTPAYCSPEQANNEDITYKTDIWSWALTVIEMLIGKRVWQFGCLAAEIFNSSDSKIHDIPKNLQILLKNCLADDPLQRPDNFAVVVSELQKIYKDISGEFYRRERPNVVQFLSDELNNRALSLFDLKKEDDVDALLKQAIEKDPQHLHATYNYSLRQWRKGKITDNDLLQRLYLLEKNYTNYWEYWLFVGFVHLERGDQSSANFALKEACKYDTNVEQSVKNVRSLLVRSTELLCELCGHDDSVRCIDVDKSGMQAASGGWDNTLRVWDLHDKKCAKVFRGHNHYVESVKWSFCGKKLLSGSWDKTIKIWDVENERCIATLVGHENHVNFVSWNCDEQKIISASWDKTIRIWDTTTQKCINILQGHEDYVTSVAVIDKERVISSSNDRTVRIWNVMSGECLGILKGHEDIIWQVIVISSSKVASASWDKTIRIWDLTSKTCVKILHGHQAAVWNLCFVPQNNTLLSTSWDKTVRIWDIESARCLRTLEGHKDRTYGIAVAPEKNIAISTSLDKTIKVWQLGNSFPPSPLGIVRPQKSEFIIECQRKFRKGMRSMQQALQAQNWQQAIGTLSQMRQIPFYSQDREVRKACSLLLPHASRKNLRGAWLDKILVGHKSYISAVAANGCYVFSTSWDKTVRMWNIESAKDHPLNLKKSRIEKIAIGENKAVFSSGKFVYIWDIENFVCLKQWQCQSRVRCLSFNNEILACGIYEKILLFDMQTGACLREMRGHNGWVESIVFSENNEIVTAGADKIIRVWDLGNGECKQELLGHTGSVKGVAIAQKNNYLVSGSWDKTVRVWDMTTGKCMKILRGHDDCVSDVAMTKDGQYVISASWDKTMCIWNVEKGNSVEVFNEHSGSVSSVCFTPDEQFAFSAGEDKKVYVWYLNWDLLI
ncbi:protein kinase domain-containing protein [Candidatus Uabimicrobium amorphum]|uniref:Protein kinase domain-containing protein n=1 Tax=Uabimicrobium amorphum TaxID=2596890 RepID=A0A5S9IUX2_UABAM|nr:serine/threonine-protein kinase [Candidatus Uabimicrobium amorphum]BBM88197.1 hypothetical protein UABAM_06618 [Candidatus Uabimicrobium amorphum]